MAKAKKSKAKKQKQHDAIELLKRDHADVKKAFKEFVVSICKAIDRHATVEEEIFYPVVRERIKDDDLMNEALVEHQSAKQLIAEIRGLSGDVCEEENEMFPKVRRLKLDLEALKAQA